MPDVIGVEAPCVDCLLHLPRLPRPNEGLAVEDSSWQGGGKVSTAMVALARLGASCGMISDIGDDGYGRFSKRDFDFHGVETTHVRLHQDYQTGLSYVLSEDETHGRNILHWNHKAAPAGLTPEDKEYLCQAKLLHLASAQEACREAAAIVHQNGGLVAFDADGYSPDIEAFIPNIDYFIASEFYYRHCYGDSQDFEGNCRQIIARGPRVCIFTFGPQGCLGVGPEGFFNEPTFPVPVVDTVGAGDVYHGAFLYGVLQGWETARSARFANAVASLKCTCIGGRAGIPTLEETLAFIKTGCVHRPEEIEHRLERYRDPARLFM